MADSDVSSFLASRKAKKGTKKQTINFNLVKTQEEYEQEELGFNEQQGLDSMANAANNIIRNDDNDGSDNLRRRGGDGGGDDDDDKIDEMIDAAAVGGDMGMIDSESNAVFEPYNPDSTQSLESVIPAISNLSLAKVLEGEEGASGDWASEEEDAAKREADKKKFRIGSGLKKVAEVQLTSQMAASSTNLGLDNDDKTLEAKLELEDSKKAFHMARKLALEKAAKEAEEAALAKQKLEQEKKNSSSSNSNNNNNNNSSSSNSSSSNVSDAKPGVWRPRVALQAAASSTTTSAPLINSKKMSVDPLKKLDDDAMFPSLGPAKKVQGETVPKQSAWGKVALPPQ